MKKEYTIRKIFLSVLMGTLIVVCFCGCGKDTAYYLEAENSQSDTLGEEFATDYDVEGTETALAGEATETEKVMLYVYVCGAIKHPGVYQLPEGSRIVDLFAIAGGITKKAAGEYWNQAQLLQDGEMYYVPTEEEASKQEQANSEPGQNNSTDKSSSDEKININTASKEQLMTIPGIGEAKAVAILNYRQEHGAFSSIEDIMQVEGIKDGVFEKIKNYIKIN